jgi:hypothetical protein
LPVLFSGRLGKDLEFLRPLRMEDSIPAETTQLPVSQSGYPARFG